MAGCFAIMGFMPAGYPLLSQICFTVAIVFSGKIKLNFFLI